MTDPTQPPPGPRLPARYDTGRHKWTYREPVDFCYGQPTRWLLGPCPQCGFPTSTYGGSYSCHNGDCPKAACNYACNPGPIPDWWEQGIAVFMDGNMWCATAPGFINLQESPAGFGETPRQAVDELRENTGTPLAQPEASEPLAELDALLLERTDDEEPPARADGPTPASKLREWDKRWRLDVDLIRCKDCGRGIHVSHRDKPLRHAPDCKLASGDAPWVELADHINAAAALPQPTTESRQ